MKANRTNTEIVAACVIYLRVSSDEQITNYSLSTQESYCKKEAERLGLKVIGIYKEEGFSAKTLKRPKLVSLLSYCKSNKHKISTVIVYKLDRISRQTSDYLAVRKTLADMGIKLVSATEPTGDTAVDKFFETIMASVAQLDNDIRSERTKAGLRTRFFDGWYSGKPPLGYTTTTKDKKQVVVRDQNTFEKVIKAWKLMATGTKSLREMQREMHKMGIRAKWAGKSWPLRPQTVNRIFRNKFYMGTLYSRIYQQELKGKHEPMITEDLFYRVQSVLDGKKTNLNMRRSVDREDFPLRGLVRCECGFKLTGAWCKGRNKKYALYWCPNSEHKTPSISADDLEGILIKHLREITPTERTTLLFLTILKRKYYKKLGGIEAKRRVAEKEVEELKETRKQLAYKNLQGTYSDDVFKEIDTELENRIMGVGIFKSEFMIDKYDIEAIVKFAKELLSDLGKAYMVGRLSQKRVLIGSIYPQGMTYSNFAFLNRTISPLFQAIRSVQTTQIAFGVAEGTRTPDIRLHKPAL